MSVLKRVSVTTRAFQMGLPLPAQFSSFILMLCLVFFAFTTIYLDGIITANAVLNILSEIRKNVIKAYKWLYILCIFIGPFMTVSAVWTIADIFNGLMAIPKPYCTYCIKWRCCIRD